MANLTTSSAGLTMGAATSPSILSDLLQRDLNQGEKDGVERF